MKPPTIMPEPDIDDIIQIIPATEWYARYSMDGDDDLAPLVAWGLTRGGEIVGLDADAGYVDVSDGTEQFAGYIFRPASRDNGDASGNIAERHPDCSNDHDEHNEAEPNDVDRE
jgi:hypothetical protein